jgi:hypothetical protein
MASHRKPRKRVPLLGIGIAAFCLLAGAAGGGAALASSGGSAPQAATLDSAWVTGAMVDSFARAVPNAANKTVYVYACLTSGRLTSFSVTAPNCPANSVRVHWVAESGPATSPDPVPSTSPQPRTSASSSPTSTASASPSPTQTSASAAPTSAAPTTTAPATPPTTAAPQPSPSSPRPSASTSPSPSPTATSPSPTGLTQCTTNQNGGANDTVTQLDGDAYHLQANEYNSGAAFKICTDGNAAFTISTSGISVSHDGAPGAYPSIYKGCHWGYCTANSGLPVAVSAMTSSPDAVTTTYDTSTINSGAWDDSYDIWYNPNRSTNNNSTGLEMMIWLNHFGGVQPAGSPGPTVTLDGIRFTVWYGGSGNGGTVSFVANTPMNSVNNLDLGPLAAYAVSRGYMQNSWFLIDVEAGFEPWTSGQGLTADAFNVTVR